MQVNPVVEVLSQEWFQTLKHNLEKAVADSDVRLPDEEIVLSQVITKYQDNTLTYNIIMSSQEISIDFGQPQDGSPTLLIDYSTYLDLLNGKIDIENAIFLGKIRAKGDFQSLTAHKQLLQIIGNALALS